MKKKQINKPRTLEETRALNESAKVAKFIMNVTSKNYSSAHKYLQAIVNDKIQTRIERATTSPLFK